MLHCAIVCFVEAAPTTPKAPDYEALASGSSYEELSFLGRQLAALENSVRASRLIQVFELASHPESLSGDGLSGVVDWLMRNLGMFREEAREFVRVAKASVECPLLLKRFASGALSWNRFCLITTGLVDDLTDLWWVENEALMTSAQIRALIAVRKAKPVDLDDAFVTRRVSVRKKLDRDIIHAELPKDLAAVVLGAIDRIAMNAPLDEESQMYPTISEARADALVQICSGSIAEDSDADLATVVVHAPIEAFRPEGGSEALAELDETLLTHETFKRLCCDARFQVSGLDTRGNTVGIGRVSRNIPPWLRRQLRRRDKGCRFPGCDRLRWTNAHHIEFWGQGGPTNLDNLVELCVKHHHYLHEFGWTISGNPETEQLRFFNREGRELTVGGYRLEPLAWDDFTERLEPIVDADDQLLRAAVGLKQPGWTQDLKSSA